MHIHPFVDGNGRTSRLLCTLCLYRSGYDFRRLFTLSEFYDRDRESFYAALQQVRVELGLTGWLDYFVRGLATELAVIRTRGEIAIRSGVIARTHNLNARQAAILDAIATEPDLGIRQIGARAVDSNRRTLQRDLRKLVDLGLIPELGSSPTDPNRRYRLNPEGTPSQL